jgi:hypothetical protein
VKLRELKNNAVLYGIAHCYGSGSVADSVEVPTGGANKLLHTLNSFHSLSFGTLVQMAEVHVNAKWRVRGRFGIQPVCHALVEVFCVYLYVLGQARVWHGVFVLWCVLSWGFGI